MDGCEQKEHNSFCMDVHVWMVGGKKLYILDANGWKQMAMRWNGG